MNTVWQDLNGDQIQSGITETGLANVAVTLFADLNNDGTYVQVATTSTGANGQYSFPSLPLGKYRVVADTADPDLPRDAYGLSYKPTTATSFDRTLTAAAPSATANFGFGTLATIGDFVFYDANINGTQDWNEVGIGGVTVRLLDPDGNVVATTVTSSGGAGNPPVGYYLFTAARPR